MLDVKKSHKNNTLSLFSYLYADGFWDTFWLFLLAVVVLVVVVVDVVVVLLLVARTLLLLLRLWR